jgi:hypothetical protein
MATGTWNATNAFRVYQVKVQFRLGLSLCQFGFGMRSTAGSADVSQAILDSVVPFMTTNLRPLLAPFDQLVSADVENVLERTGVSHDFGNIGGTSDAQGVTAEPSMLACVVSMKSGVRTRLGTGRFFFPLRSEGQVSGDVLSDGGRQGIQAFVTAFAGEYIGVNPVMGARLANFHGALPERPRTGRRATELGPLPAIESRWYDVESLRLNTVVTALKSRKAGVGS